MEDRRIKKYRSSAYRYAFSGLVLHTALFYEDMLSGLELSKREEEIRQEFDRLLKRWIQGGGNLEEVEALRNKINGAAEIMASYTDCFQLYRYVLAKVQRRFVKLAPSEYTLEEMTDAVIENFVWTDFTISYLRNIIAILPVRFTRKKFYSMVTERLLTYTGILKEEMEFYLNKIKLSAMVQFPEGMDSEEELYRNLEVLRQGDYRNLDKAGYEKCQTALIQGADLLAKKVDFYQSVQEMVNDLYILYLTKDKKTTGTMEDQAFWQGIGKLQKAVETGEELSYEEEEQILEPMEGIQEAVEDVVMAGVPESCSDPELKKVEKLVSGSLFGSLEERDTSGERTDRAWLEQQAESLCGELDKLFSSAPKIVVRSVMGVVLSCLPFPFKNNEEFRDYIRSSLESCTDYAEREGCLELLEQELME